MTIAFTLSMPGNNSWNGRWSGDGRLHVIVRSIGSKKVAERVLSQSSYGYDFGDGWYASVSVRQVDKTEAGRLRRRSDGFCGYDWMVDSIVSDGEIYGPMHPRPEAQTA